MKSNLIKNSQKLCKDANQVVEKTKVLEVFSKLGKVEIIGSLRLKLMYRLDIDLLVISDQIDKRKAQNTAKQFIDTGIFQTVGLADNKTFPAYDMPLGFYWELIIPHKGKNWKFDVWYLKPEERFTHLVFDLIKRFETELAKNPEKAGIILKIKEAYFDGVKYKDKVTSFNIYTAVLEKGINSVQEFSDSLKTR